MASLNKVMIIGNLGRDPEMKALPNGDTVATFSVATTESYTNKATGEKTDKTEWHRVTMWRKLAEVAAKHLKKGTQVYIEGKLVTRKWQDQNGQERSSTEIVADNMAMLGGRGEGQPAPQKQAPVQQYSEDDLPF